MIERVILMPFWLSYCQIEIIRMNIILQIILVLIVPAERLTLLSFFRSLERICLIKKDLIVRIVPWVMMFIQEIVLIFILLLGVIFVRILIHILIKHVQYVIVSMIMILQSKLNNKSMSTE